MLAFKGILRYAVYLFVGGWMFFLGIMVGRGTSPVTFDTQNFHKRLETIVREFEKGDEPEEKMDLQFYDALKKPVRQEVKGKKNNPNEIIPKKEGQIQMPVAARIPVKTSMKAATLNKIALNKSLLKDSGYTPSKDTLPGDRVVIAKAITKKEKQLPAKDAGELSAKKTIRKVPSKKIIEKKSPVSEGSPAKTGESLAGVKPAPGKYTIQVAAYKSFTDAVTQMAILEKKGFVSYRTLGKKEGVTWYRVRVGSFATRDAARLYVGKLKQAKIDGMIIKKE